MNGELQVLDALAGKRILIAGSTGFLGRVVLSLLLYRQPDVGRVFILARKLGDRDAEQDFFETARESPVFEPLRAEYEDDFDRFLRERIQVLPGDMTLPDCGLSSALLQTLAGRVDLVLNAAGLTAMHAGLDDSFRINTLGPRHVAQLAQKLGAKLVHVSTAYVAGNRSGMIPEDDSVTGYFPRWGRMESAFSVSREIAECERFIRDIRARAESESQQAQFREELLRRRRERDTRGGERSLQSAVNRSTKRWTFEQLVQLGQRRAHHWGWPNVYCYTKAMGEQAIAEKEGLDYVILRPTIIESALSYPFPGWIEGISVTAPTIYAMLRGQTLWPIRGRYALDVVPVDFVAAGALAVSGAALTGRHERVYHLGTSDANPFLLRRCVRYISQYRRGHFKEFALDSKLVHWLRTRIGVIRVPYAAYQGLSAPTRRRALARFMNMLETVAPRLVPKRVTKMERRLGQVENIVLAFLPFVHDNRYIFQSGRIRDLYGRMSAEDRELLPWEPEKIRWRYYWQRVHIEGLRRWVFPSAMPPGIPRRDPAFPVHGCFVRFVRRVFDRVAATAYERLFRTSVCGAAPVPMDRRFVVASNHASHLDMGLIKHAMGPAGEHLASMAAKDYFFNAFFKRFFFAHFTNLLPMDRGRGFKESIRLAGEALRRDRNILIFPEGTRSKTGEIGTFKPSVGYLALRNQVDVLPVYVHGTFQAMPKGQHIPSFGLDLAAHVGEPLKFEDLRKSTEHLPIKEAYRAATAQIEEAVRRLRGEHERNCRLG